MDDLPDEINDSIRLLSKWMDMASPEDRLALRSELMEPYCDHRGGPASSQNFPGAPSQSCQCWNDE